MKSLKRKHNRRLQDSFSSRKELSNCAKAHSRDVKALRRQKEEEYNESQAKNRMKSFDVNPRFKGQDMRTQDER